MILVVAMAWIYVVLMMAVVEATSAHGTVLGALITFVFYGVLPLTIVLYLMASPARRHRQRTHAAEAVAADTSHAAAQPPSSQSDSSVRVT